MPDKPGSLLPVKDEPEQDGQSATKVTIGAPISLATSINSQKFGQMLYNPFSETKQVIRQASNDTLNADLVALNRQGLERFAAYLVGEEETSALDAIVLFTPYALRGLSGGIGLFFGSDVLKYFFSNSTASSVNALIPISDTIPSGYEIELYNPQVDEVELDKVNLKLDKSEGGQGIDLESITDTPINWEEWIKEAVVKQYGADGLSKLPVAIDNFPDLIRNALAPFFYRAGMDNFPFILPQTLIEDPKEGEIEEQVQARDLSEFLLWQVTAFDSVLGQFPIKIRIQDSDLIKTGDQELRLEFPNLAETLTEIVTLALSNQTNNDALLKMGLNELAEQGKTKQLSIQNQYL